MKVAIVGLGMAGSTLACLLADRGLDVVVLEQEEDPQPVGAGIWLQHMGQQVLDRLGLLAPLRAQSREVSRVDIRTAASSSANNVPRCTPSAGTALGTAAYPTSTSRRPAEVRMSTRDTSRDCARSGASSPSRSSTC